MPNGIDSRGLLSANYAEAGPIDNDWKANTEYSANQLVVYNGTLYRALASFTSGATFNAANWTLVDSGSFTQVVVHGATGSTARPSSTGIVQWIGTATPANAITDDLWWDSTNLLNKHYNGAAWESSGVNAYASLVGTLYFIDHQVISTSETIGSGAGNDGFRDLATVGPTITFTVPAAQTWNILVRFGCGATTATGEGGNVAVSVDGATPAVADSASAFAVTGFGTVHREIKVTGLTAGVHTLTLKYRHSSSTAATYSFVNRWISALRVM